MIGRTISHYEILEKLGEGGMGIVYGARDTHLNRHVALKLLHAEAVQRPDRKLRFIQEARAASALNHPNIITIYEIDHVDNVDVIAMEYIQGKTLDQLIGKKGLRLSDTLRYAVQIADALAAAHFAGIVHRDLKPANVMVAANGLVKILDFGLAKLTEDYSEETRSSDTGEALHPRTRDGVIVGTAAYMSPEQAEGKKVDARSDIFSFGALLYEMLSGRRPFPGEGNAAAIAAILRDDPQPLQQLVPDLPQELGRLAMRALRKDPGRRFQHMDDVRVALQELREEYESGTLLAAGPPSPREHWTWDFALALFGLLVLLGVGLAWWKFLQPRSKPAPILRRLTSDPGLTAFPAVSPDGRLVAYASDRGGGDLDIWVQQVSGGQPIRLTSDPADEYEATFAPDSGQIAFRSEREGGGIYLISTLGGEPRLVARRGRSPSFSPDGTRIAFVVGAAGVGAAFSHGASDLYVVSLSDSEPKRLRQDFPVAHHPVWTSDGKHILFLGGRELGPPTYDWWVTPIDGGEPTSTGALEALRKQEFNINPYPMAFSGGTIVFTAGRGDNSNLWRLGLSPSTWKPDGPPEQLTFGTAQEFQPSLSSAGRVVFTSGRSNIDVWSLPINTDEGKPTGTLRQLTRDAGDDYYPEVSLDGKKIAYISKRSGNDDVWVADLATGRESPLVVTPLREMYPKLSPDASLAAYTTIEEGRRALYIVPTSGGVPQKLCQDCGLLRDVSSDGSKILYQGGPPPFIGLLDAGTLEHKELLKHAKFPLYAARFSPDQRWIVFQAAHRPSARILYIAPFREGSCPPESGWLPVTDGAAMDRNAVWSPNGNMLYFLSERDSFRCIWAQRLDPATKRAAGLPFAIAHFHEALRSMMNVEGPAQIGLSVATGSLVFSLGELTGNIWITDISGKP